MDMNTPLPACPNICAPCYIGASTTYVEFPYNITTTVDVTLIPLVTGLADGTNSTYSVETITDTAYQVPGSGSGEQTAFDGDEPLTWTTYGTILTFPTTYAYFQTFSATGAPSTTTEVCADRTRLTRLNLPPTTAPAQFVYAPSSGTDASTELALGALPTPLLGYLGSLDDVVAQLGANAPSLCSATTAPVASDLECTTLISSSSCFSTFTDARGTLSSSCATETLISTTTIKGPTTQSNVPTSSKVPAAVLRRVDGPAKFAPFTPPPGAGAPTPSPAQPQNEGPPADNNNPPAGGNTPSSGGPPASPDDNTPQQGLPPSGDQPAVPDDGTSTPPGVSPPPEQVQDTPASSPETPPAGSDNGTSSPPGSNTQAEDNPTAAPAAEEPTEGQEQVESPEQSPGGQETGGTIPPEDDASAPVSTPNNSGSSDTVDETSTDDPNEPVPPLTASVQQQLLD